MVADVLIISEFGTARRFSLFRVPGTVFVDLAESTKTRADRTRAERGFRPTRSNVLKRDPRARNRPFDTRRRSVVPRYVLETTERVVFAVRLADG